eukprot:scaffold98767_cov32-Tisochrysis_lutea.AAC.8
MLVLAHLHLGLFRCIDHATTATYSESTHGSDGVSPVSNKRRPLQIAEYLRQARRKKIVVGWAEQGSFGVVSCIPRIFRHVWRNTDITYLGQYSPKQARFLFASKPIGQCEAKENQLCADALSKWRQIRAVLSSFKCYMPP